MGITDCTSTLQVIEHLRAAAMGADCDFSFTQLADTLERTLQRDLNRTPYGVPTRRNCDVMVTAAALRKGWERRCDYGTPCCPFEYALENFDEQEEKHAD